MIEYLASAPVIATHSVEEAREAVSRIYLSHDLSIAHKVRDSMLDMHFNATTGGHLTLGYLTYQADVELTMPPTEDCYIVNLTIAGATRGSRGDGVRERTAGDERGLVLTPVQSHRVHWSPDAEQLHLKIPRARLESHLADLIGKPVTKLIDFAFGIDLTSGAGRGLLRSVCFLAAELDRPAGLAEAPLARAQLEAYVLSSLLHAGRHQFSAGLVDPNNVRRLGRLAPVLQYIEANAESDLTPEVLARAAGVSVRSLHAAFHEHLGESPMAYVRRVRLGRVRAELLRSDPTKVRVTDVAMRWGFVHLSRFAEQYRAQFNELPSLTLHR
jgi:AraC-like DNA-binding protein